MSRTDSATIDSIPKCPEAEVAVLGSMMTDPDTASTVRTILAPEDFYSTAHKRVYEALVSLVDRGHTVDLVSVVEELRGRGDLQAIGGASFVQSLMDSARPGAVHHAGIVAEKSFRRQLSDQAARLITACHNGEDPATARDALARVHRRAETASVMRRAVLTGTELENAVLPAIEPILGNGLLARGDYGLLCGPKGSGKSWFMLQLAASVAEGSDFLGWRTIRGRALVLSLELTRDKLRERMRAIRPAGAYENILFYAKDSLADVPGSAGISPIPRLAYPEDQARVLELVQSIAPDLVLIDPLGPAVLADENVELASIARFLLELASRGHCAVLASHHPRKGDPAAGNGDGGIHEMRGPSQLGDWAASAFVLKPSRGIYSLKSAADPRHCPAPGEVWLTRTELGTFEVTDAPERQAEAVAERQQRLREAIEERGSITTADAAGMIGVSERTTRDHLRAIGAVPDGHKGSSRWVFSCGSPAETSRKAPLPQQLTQFQEDTPR